ncbi:MAG: hypothetical protein CSYNP_03658 [Syntrophus sp. SKADARSKE-3]|nr:hypothetical protein [Syntrophus sp. SKADARSKE-3]
MARRKTTTLSLTGIVAVSKFADKARFKERVNGLVAQFTDAIRGQSFVGTEPGPPLEHTTRRHFIDGWLGLLGWDLTKLNDEMIEEARTRGETTFRLDYLGVNQQTRIPLIIVEAKAWETPFVAPSARGKSVEGSAPSRPLSLICAAIEHCKAGGAPKDSPVIAEWAEYLAKLHQYVTLIRNESGHTVTRVALLSGQWLVIFKDPEAIFLTCGKVNPLVIGVYQGGELVSESDAIYDQLARSVVSDALPSTIRPSLLPAYIRTKDVKQAYRALWVSRQAIGASWKPRPSLDFEVAMLLERRDGVLLTVTDESLQGASMPHDYRELTAHIATIESQSDKLLQRSNGELETTLQVSAVEVFPGFCTSKGNMTQNFTNAGNQRRTNLIKTVGKVGEFLLVTGKATHFLFGEPSVDHCDCHDWGFCQSQAQESGREPICIRSVNPKAFFKSSERHHCAHRLVHDRRNSQCQIDAFEEFLCCRACALQDFCWKPQELAALPCGAVAAT